MGNIVLWPETPANNASTKIKAKPTIGVFFMEITFFLWSFSVLSVFFLTSEEKMVDDSF